MTEGVLPTNSPSTSMSQLGTVASTLTPGDGAAAAEVCTTMGAGGGGGAAATAAAAFKSVAWVAQCAVMAAQASCTEPPDRKGLTSRRCCAAGADEDGDLVFVREESFAAFVVELDDVVRHHRAVVDEDLWAAAGRRS